MVNYEGKNIFNLAEKNSSSNDHLKKLILPDF
jgi:hypothetical protein